MSIINLDSLSLMAFSSDEVIEAWRESVIEEERGKDYDPDITISQNSISNPIFIRITK